MRNPCIWLRAYAASCCCFHGASGNLLYCVWCGITVVLLIIYTSYQLLQALFTDYLKENTAQPLKAASKPVSQKEKGQPSRGKEQVPAQSKVCQARLISYDRTGMRTTEPAVRKTASFHIVLWLVGFCQTLDLEKVLLNVMCLVA